MRRVLGYGLKLGHLLLVQRVKVELVCGASLPSNDETARQPCRIKPPGSHVDIESGWFRLHQLREQQNDERPKRQDENQRHQGEFPFGFGLLLLRVHGRLRLSHGGTVGKEILSTGFLGVGRLAIASIRPACLMFRAAFRIRFSCLELDYIAHEAGPNPVI